MVCHCSNSAYNLGSKKISEQNKKHRTKETENKQKFLRGQYLLRVFTLSKYFEYSRFWYQRIMVPRRHNEETHACSVSMELSAVLFTASSLPKFC
jgi:hypothetical protein